MDLVNIPARNSARVEARRRACTRARQTCQAHKCIMRVTRGWIGGERGRVIDPESERSMIKGQPGIGLASIDRPATLGLDQPQERFLGACVLDYYMTEPRRY